MSLFCKRQLASSRMLIIFTFASFIILGYILGAPAGAWAAPVFSEQTPAPNSVAPSSRPEISVYVYDSVNINGSSLTMTVNGVRVTAWWNPTPLKPNQGRVTCYSSYLSADLPLGVNTVTVTIKNANGVIGSTTWSFNVQTVPQITNFVPRAYGEVYTRPFIIRADVTSPNGIKSVSMTLDGKVLRTTYTNSQICYNPTLFDPVVPNGAHTVRVTATDNAGITNTATWKFTCEFWGDDDKSNLQCTGCHNGFPAPNHPVTNCAGCHSTIPVLSNISWPPNYGVHDPGYIYAWDCQYCHDSRFAVPLHPADNTAYHNTTTPFDSCRECHMESLTNQHTTGCSLCHSSAAAQPVQDAVNNQDKRCEACHVSANHEALHETPGLLDPNCTTCHVNSLSQEHLSNTKTQTQTLACGTCHDATETTNAAVYRAVYLSNIQCAACHSQAHTVNLAERLNADIPVYEGFNWSQPISAAIFNDEPWIPGEFASAAKIVFSNRRNDVNGDAVFNFYKDALTGKGWVLAPPTPESGSNFFTAIFSKGKYRIAIMFDDREYHSLSLPTVTSGYRITIIYN